MSGELSRSNHLLKAHLLKSLNMDQTMKATGIMIICQMEDYIYVMAILYPYYGYLFLFDQSHGHDKQRKDGLNVENMSKSYRGKQSFVQPTSIKEEAGHLGTYP